MCLDLVNPHDPIVNWFAVKYVYFVSLVTSSKLCITFKGYALVFIAARSPSCVVFIPFLPFEAKTAGHRRKSRIHQDVSRKKSQMLFKYWKVHLFLRWLFSLHVVASCLVQLVHLSFGDMLLENKNIYPLGTRESKNFFNDLFLFFLSVPQRGSFPLAQPRQSGKGGQGSPGTGGGW